MNPYQPGGINISQSLDIVLKKPRVNNSTEVANQITIHKKNPTKTATKKPLQNQQKPIRHIPLLPNSETKLIPFVVVKEAAKMTPWLTFTHHCAPQTGNRIKREVAEIYLNSSFKRVEKYGMFKVTFAVSIKCISSL